MIRINENYLKLKASYLFSDIAKRVANHQQDHPEAEVIRLGIGDVTRALSQSMHRRLSLCRGRDGRRCQFLEDTDRNRAMNFCETPSPKTILRLVERISMPMKFSSAMAPNATPATFKRSSTKMRSSQSPIRCTRYTWTPISWPVAQVPTKTDVTRESSILTVIPKNGFVPELPQQQVDLIYLCFPNNPTGATITKDQLATWVDYARDNRAIILFDAAYEAFIRDDTLPRSIYEIEGAKEVAIEFRSFSKTAGFTGTRCAYTVIPKSLMAYSASGEARSVHGLWNRRHSTKFNGVSYPVQRAAAAIYEDDGKKQVKDLIDYYMTNARLIRESMKELGYDFIGGENSPYIWVSTPTDSWSFFDMLLEKSRCGVHAGSRIRKLW